MKHARTYGYEHFKGFHEDISPLRRGDPTVNGKFTFMPAFCFAEVMSEIVTLANPTTAPDRSTAEKMKDENDKIRDRKLIFWPTAARAVTKRTEARRKRKR